MKYDGSLDKNVGETAENMVRLVDMSGQATIFTWGDDEIVVTPYDSVDYVQVQLETSTDRQQEEAGL